MTDKLHEHWKLEAKKLSKSSTQVASLVGPKVPPKTCAPAKPGRRRPHPIRVRLSAIELRTVRENAKEVGCTLNAYVKASALKRLPMGPELQDMLFLLNRELTAQGRNLNQIAKHLNSGQANISQGTAMLEAIRAPLIIALKAVKIALTESMPEP
ncbi:MAG: hypothetical protein P4N59_05585 [Negativicutes bacterium]|nr:hypothetical protein [Negativicutes bacterium]